MIYAPIVATVITLIVSGVLGVLGWDSILDGSKKPAPSVKEAGR